MLAQDKQNSYSLVTHKSRTAPTDLGTSETGIGTSWISLQRLCINWLKRHGEAIENMASEMYMP